MRAPAILPNSYPDQIRDVDTGGTVYIHPEDMEPETLSEESAAWILIDNESPKARTVVRLRDGAIRIVSKSVRVRVVSLEAITSREDW